MGGSEYAWIGEANTSPSLEELYKSSVLAFDVEATGTRIPLAGLVGISMAYRKEDAYTFPARDLEIPLDILADDTKLKIAHNSIYDRSVLKNHGIIVDRLADTMIAAHLLQEAFLALKGLSSKWLYMDITSFSELGKPISELSLEELGRYSGLHSIATLMLWGIFEKELIRWGLSDIFWGIEMPLVPVLSDMETAGVGIDVDALLDLRLEFDGKIRTIIEVLDFYSDTSGINYNSPDQVAHLLFTKLGLPSLKETKKGKRPSTDASVLESLVGKHPVIKPLMLFKQYQKLKSNYVDGLIPKILNGRVYGSFNQTGTRTGRLSSSDPNLQNIPMRWSEGRRIRRAFVAPPGCVFIYADYNQLELRMMAHYSQDAALIDAFLNDRDIHEETAILVFGNIKLRFDGKTLNYQIIYGGGDTRRRELFFKAYPGVKKWTTKQNLLSEDAGYVRTLHGRMRAIEELQAESRRIVERGQREGISTIIQGSSAEEVKLGMIRAWKALKGTGAKLVLQVHDELLYEVPEDQVNEVANILSQTLPSHELSVPLTISLKVGKNWRDLEELRVKDSARI